MRRIRVLSAFNVYKSWRRDYISTARDTDVSSKLTSKMEIKLIRIVRQLETEIAFLADSWVRVH